MKDMIRIKESANMMGGSYFNRNDIKYTSKRAGRWITHIFSKKYQDNTDVLFISRDRFVKIESVSDNLVSDSLFFSIISELSTQHPDINLNLLCKASPPKNLNIKAVNVDSYTKFSDLLNSAFFSVKKIIQWRINKYYLANRMNPDKSIDSHILYSLDSFFSLVNLGYYSIVDYCYYNALKKLNPRVVISNDDVLQFKPRSKNNYLKFITLQSSTISPSNETYQRKFIHEFGSESIRSDYFICQGEYFKKLKDYSNTSKKVVVMGQPRYDILAHASEIYDKSKIVMDLGLDPNKKIILWCTQTHGMSSEENISSINAVYNTMTSLKDEVQLVIKLHPSEDQDAPLYYDNTSYKPVILKKDVDTNALLYSCEMMITKNSTTAMEAVILNKPVIVLNLSGDPDQVNFVSEGVALGVYDQVDLFSATKKILDDNSILHEKREEYIKKYLYKIDGKATERVVNLIISLLDESKS